MKSARKLIQGCLLGAALLPAAIGGAQTVTNIAAGNGHSLFLKNDGSLWAMGNNANGQLGDGTLNQTNLPEQILAGNVTALAAGAAHSLFLKTDGSLWVMGYNPYGQLGDGVYNLVTPFGTNQPQKILASGVTAIAAGQNHSLFIKSDGSLWGMGWNQQGQLGIGIYTTLIPYGTNQPQHVVTTNGVTAIAGGYQHSLFVKDDGSLWAMGNNTFGQLGNGTFTQTNRPVLVVASGVAAVTAGYQHSLFLKNDGSLWGMGYNFYGQLGDGTFNNTNRPELIVSNGVTAIAAGQYHSLFLKSDGSLWAMGANSIGQLGDGTFTNRNRPEKIVPYNVTAIAGGQNHSLFAQADGSLWGMGYNGYGQLGDGTYNPTNRPEPLVGFLAYYNQISIHLLGGGQVQLIYEGNTGTNYALDRSFPLAPLNWVPQKTNTAGVGGVVIFTNSPNPATNNYWRVRSVP